MKISQEMLRNKNKWYKKQLHQNVCVWKKKTKQIEMNACGHECHAMECYNKNTYTQHKIDRHKRSKHLFSVEWGCWTECRPITRANTQIIFRLFIQLAFFLCFHQTKSTEMCTNVLIHAILKTKMYEFYILIPSKMYPHSNRWIHFLFSKHLFLLTGQPHSTGTVK